MIISDTHRLAFVHIPKCAGTSIRAALQHLDETQARFTRRVEYHSALGVIDYVHIPLFVLYAHFPNEFRKVRDYHSVAMVRDPFERFASSFSQHMKYRKNGPIGRLTRKQAALEVDRAIAALLSIDSRQRYLPWEYVHFQRQVDYVVMNGERIVSRVFRADAVEDILEDLGCRIGQPLRGRQAEAVKSNQAMVFRNRLIGRLAEYVRPVVGPADGAVPRTAKRVARQLVYVPRDRRLSGIFGSDYVRDFIGDFYREDIEFVQREICQPNQESGINSKCGHC